MPIIDGHREKLKKRCLRGNKRYEVTAVKYMRLVKYAPGPQVFDFGSGHSENVPANICSVFAQ
jgi:hypothetical protein